jgi:hypothetical protein
VDRVIREHREMAFDIFGGDEENTIGEAEHGFILWRKRYIIIPGAAAKVLSPLPQLPHDRCG